MKANKTNKTNKVKTRGEVTVRAELTDGIDRKQFAQMCSDMGRLDSAVFFALRERFYQYIFVTD